MFFKLFGVLKLLGNLLQFKLVFITGIPHKVSCSSSFVFLLGKVCEESRQTGCVDDVFLAWIFSAALLLCKNLSAPHCCL